MDNNSMAGIDCSQSVTSTRGEISNISEEETQSDSNDDAGYQITQKHFRGLGCCLSDDNTLELLKSNGLDNVSSQTVFNLMNRILDGFGRWNRSDDFVLYTTSILKNAMHVIEKRMSNQTHISKSQNKLHSISMEKCQLRIRALETLFDGTSKEIEVLCSQLQKMKIEKTKIEEKVKHEEEDLQRLKEEKTHIDKENQALKQEIEMEKTVHEENCWQLRMKSDETKTQLDGKLKELECFLAESRKKVKELEMFSETESQCWKSKERAYESLLNCHIRVFEELRDGCQSIKHEMLKTTEIYLREFNCFVMKLEELTNAAESYHSVLAENRRLYNEVQDLKGNIRVYCRIRPFIPGQCKMQTNMEYIGENGELAVFNPSKQGKDGHRLFKFNKVFGPTASQEEVFLDTQPLIRSVLDGYNVCIFAYGQTGSGKTYTMTGPDFLSEEHWGVNCRALHDLFHISRSRKNAITYKIGVQMVEIYNEQVRDLLIRNGSHKRLGIWNTAHPNGLAVPDATMHSVNSIEDVMELMNIGSINRAVGLTAQNERSSRSHSVLTVHVHGIDVETGVVLHGSLHLVDLAGSERVERSEATGDRLKEAQHINKSLSALGDVIFALAQKNSHVPYRNSKLTQLLQSSLGGQAKSLMFVHLNPDAGSYHETISTLKFGERVSGVELGAARSNKEKRYVRELMDQVSSLKNVIAKKEEEIDWLKLRRGNGEVINQSRCRTSPPAGRLSSARTPRLAFKLSARKQQAGQSEGDHRVKQASDVDGSSEHSEKYSQASSLPSSIHGFEEDQRSLPRSSSAAGFISGHNSKDDNTDDLLDLGDGDSDERLSDISDSVLSLATETDCSIHSAIELTPIPAFLNTAALLPPALPSEKPTSSSDRVLKPSEKLRKIKTGRLSLPRSSATRIPSKGTPNFRNPCAGSLSSTRSHKATN